jgi:adenine-specific DNA methylase
MAFEADTSVVTGPKSADLLRLGIDDYQALFSSRQLLYLRTAIDALQQVTPQHRTYLALLISTSLEFNVMLCGYKGSGLRRAGAVRHAFSHHAYSFPYTAVENNPVFDGRTSGSLGQLFRDRVRRARKWAQAPKERSPDSETPRFLPIEGEVDYGRQVDEVADLGFGQRRFYVGQGSAAELGLDDDSVDLVITDPPYFDSVQYGSLSAFFRVWLRQMVEGDPAHAIRWDYSLSESAVDSGGHTGDDHYVDTMSAIFGECRRVLKPEVGRLAFTFHHWKAAGWAAITIALRRSGFWLQDYYVVHSENPISVHIANMNALTDDAILVLSGARAGSDRTWRQPRAMDSESSAAFCRDCAEGVGWLLASASSEREISSWWVRRLGEHAGRDRKRPPTGKR